MKYYEGYTLDDIEESLKRDKSSEEFERLINETAALSISQDQLATPGELLGHFSTNKSLLITSTLIMIFFIVGIVFLGTVSNIFFVFLIPIVILGIGWFLYLNKKVLGYIDIYENALIGKVECSSKKSLVEIKHGAAYFKGATVEKGILYITIYNNKTMYRVRNLKRPDKAAFLINKHMGHWNV